MRRIVGPWLRPIMMLAAMGLLTALDWRLWKQWRQVPVIESTGFQRGRAHAGTPPAKDLLHMEHQVATEGHSALRPLFTQTRRPRNIGREASDGSFEATPAEPPFTLAGIITGKAKNIALVRLNGDATVVSVAVGGELDGWRLMSVMKEAATFRSAASETTMVLDFSAPEVRGGASKSNSDQ